MLTEDHFMRMINLAVAAIVRAIGLRKDGQYAQAHQAVEQALEQLTGLRSDILQNLEDTALLDTLTIQGSLDVERALIVTDLYQEQGEIYQAQNQNSLACSNWKSALTLLLECGLSSPLEEAKLLQAKVESLVRLALPCELPFDSGFALFSYYEITGCYAKAALALELLLETGRFQTEVKQEIQDFCLRLLQLPEAILESGGLTPSLVQEMLRNAQR